MRIGLPHMQLTASSSVLLCKAWAFHAEAGTQWHPNPKPKPAGRDAPSHSDQGSVAGR